MQPIELLAPAKNKDYGIAAINCGADAVYIGAPRFGARSAAANNFNDIQALVNYAHKFSAKVYLTLNTLLFDHEIEEARETINTAWNSGIDAIIIQDMGFLELDLPPIPVFASTQTHNINWQKVKFLEDIGFRRVILARELALSEIKEIRNNTTIDLESFVHGAICVCYSGQCYLSHAITGKSGNRGECAQLCRWKYQLTDKSGNKIGTPKHYLSPKDLNLSGYIEELMDAGISSFKIEGRLKDLAYVKNITGWYRKKIDDILNRKSEYSKSSRGTIKSNFEPNPQNTFNRGYTDYYLNQKRNHILSFNTPKSIGKEVASVIMIKHKSLIVNPKEEIHNGDGLCFIDTSGNLEGFRVNKITANEIFPLEMPDIKKGTILFRNHDQHFEDLISKSIDKRNLTIQMELFETKEGISLRAFDNFGNNATYTLKCEKNVAINSEIALNTIKQNLSKAGNTIFSIENIEIKLSNVFFIKASEINELRRQTLHLLEQEILKNYTRESFKISPNNSPFPFSNNDYRLNVINTFSEKFYLRHGVKGIEKGLELTQNHRGKTLMTTKACIRFELGECPISSGKGTENDKYYLETGNGVKLEVSFNCKECISHIT